MAEERREYEVPPTRPSTPLNRDPRIAEAPSRADPRLPSMATSSSDTITSTAHDHREAVNHDLAGHTGNRDHYTSTPDSAPAMVNGNTYGQSKLDMTLSSCTDRFYVPTPHNSPVRRNSRQSVIASTMAATRLRGGGPSKRSTASPHGSAAKKKKTSGSKGRAKKSKDDIFDDSEATLADGNSPLYDDSNIAAILQHPLAQSTLVGSVVGAQLQCLTVDELRRATNDFRNDGRSGFNDPDHLQQGLAATQRRTNGEFDEFSKQKFVETWIDDTDSSNSEQEMDRDLHAFDSMGLGASNKNVECSLVSRELDAFNEMGPCASNDNMEATNEARELDSFNATGPDVSIETLNPSVARELNALKSTGAGTSNEGDADAQEEENEQEENSFYTGDYDIRPNHHRRKDDDDPGGPATSGAPRDPGSSSRQQAKTFESHTTNSQGSNNSQSVHKMSREGYFSNYVHISAPPRHAITSIVSPLKFEVMCRKHEHVSGKFQQIIKSGDILRLEIGGKAVKEVTLVREHLGHFVISVPPGTHIRSEPDLRADLIYPSPNNNETITGPTQIYSIVQRLVGLTADRPAWKSFSAVHEDEVLGNINDIRQALEWSWTEGAFRAQLRFEKFRRRRLRPAHKDDGYEFINHSTLFRKIRTSELTCHNLDLIIDLGPRLNDELARYADSQDFTIVMVDNRLFGSDGLFPAIDVHINEAFSQGHRSFPTRFCRDLAGSEGWSNGHAHIGPLGLGKGIGHSIWEGGKKNVLCKGPGWLNVGALGLDKTPPGVKWSSSEIQKVTEFHNRDLLGQIRHFPIPINRGRQHWGLQPQQFRRTGDDQWILDPDFPLQGTALTIQPANLPRPGTVLSSKPLSFERAQQLQTQPLHPRRATSPATDSSLSHHRKTMHTQPLNPPMTQHLEDVCGMDDFTFAAIGDNSQPPGPPIDYRDASGDSYYYPPSPTSEPFIPHFSRGESNASNNHPRYQQAIEPQLRSSNRDPDENFIDPFLLGSDRPQTSVDPCIDRTACSLAESTAQPLVGSPSENILESRDSHWFHATAAQLLLECRNGKPKSWFPPSNEILHQFFTNNTLRLLPNPISRSQDPPDALYPALTEEGAAIFATREWVEPQMRCVPIPSGLAVQCMSPTYGSDGKFNGWTERWVDAFSDPRLVRPYHFQEEQIMTSSLLVSKNLVQNSQSDQQMRAVFQPQKTPLGYSSPYRSNRAILNHSVVRPISSSVFLPKSLATVQQFEQYELRDWGLEALRKKGERDRTEAEAAETLRSQAKAALQETYSTDNWLEEPGVASVGDKQPSSDATRPDIPNYRALPIEALLNPCTAIASAADNVEKESGAFEAENAAPKPCVEVYNKAKYCSGSYPGLFAVGVTSVRQPLTTKVCHEDQSPSEHQAKRARLAQ